MTENNYISVGIDVGADFSYMSIALPNRTLVGKPFKITHANQNSLFTALERIRETEKHNSLKARVFLESTGVYHYPLFRWFRNEGFDVAVINPLITSSSKNFNVRKVHNDKFDSKKLALLALNPELKISVIPSELVLSIRNLVREYYRLKDCQSAYVNKLTAALKVSFPEYIGVFSKITVKTSLSLLKRYPTPDAVLSARKSTVIKIIKNESCFGDKYAEEKYQKLIQAAESAKIFSCPVSSDAILIRSFISFIKNYEKEMQQLLRTIRQILDEHPEKTFVKQIQLLESIKGCGFLSAVTLMCEIGDFSVFSSPKQLYAYFGLDPEVKQSGKFNGNDVKISKRGSRLARRVLHMMAVNNIAVSKNKVSKNHVMRSFYEKKCQSKPKMVALGAVIHKLCNIIFAVLRDNKPFEIRTPEQHCSVYLTTQKSAA